MGPTLWTANTGHDEVKPFAIRVPGETCGSVGGTQPGISNVFIGTNDWMESLDFGAHEVFPYFGSVFLKMKLHAGLNEVERVGYAGFLREFALGRMHEITICGLHLPGDRLPNVAALGRALEKKDLDLGRSAVNNDLNLSNDEVRHAFRALYMF